MCCVGQMVREASTTAEKKQQASHDHSISTFISGLRDGLMKEGVEVTLLDTAIDSALRNASIAYQPPSKRSLPPAPAPPAKHIKVTKNRGEKELPQAPTWKKTPPAEKLEWIDRYADGNTSQYVEKSRSLLKRINPIAHCYRSCCRKDLEVFLSRHGKPSNGKAGSEMNFSVTGFKRCDNCK